MDHARLFASHGIAVTIVCGEGEGSGEAGIDVTVLRELRRGGSDELSAETTAQLKALLARQDVVFLHNVLTMPFHPGLTKALSRIAAVGSPARSTQFVAWIHDVAAANPAYAPVPEIFRQAHERVEYVAVSEVRRREWCAVSGLPPVRCRVIPNGIDLLERLRLTPAVRRLAEEWRILERDVVVLHPTRLLQRKNVEMSLRVAAELLRYGVPALAGEALHASMSQNLGEAVRDDTVPPPKGGTPYLCASSAPRLPPGPLLLITGAADPHHAPSAAYADSLRCLRSELHLDEHVCFVSDYFSPTDADVDSLYALADALLYPSHQEGFGLPILEAALHRLPIFCRDLETLTALLPHAALTVFPDDAAPAHVAGELRRQVEASRTIRNRKAVVQRYGWPAIYHNFLAPLLAGTETPPFP
jgi:glycosyltransferase involved in cell wall biosynthesis